MGDCTGQVSIQSGARSGVLTLTATADSVVEGSGDVQTGCNAQ